MRSQFAIDHFRTGIIAIASAPCGVSSDHILASRLRRQPDQQSIIIVRLQRFAGHGECAVDRWQVEKAFSRCFETGDWVLGKFLRGQPSQGGPLFSPPRDLLNFQSVSRHQLSLFFGQGRKILARIKHVRGIKPPRKKMWHISRFQSALPLLVKESTRPVWRGLQDNLAARDYR